MSNRQYLAHRIRNKMVHHGMKNKDLAEALNVSPPYCSKLLRGNENLTLGQLEKIADALHCRLTVDLS